MVEEDSVMVTFMGPDPIVISFSENPIEETTNVLLFAGTVREKLPSPLVEVPMFVPLTVTVAPMTG